MWEEKLCSSRWSDRTKASHIDMLVSTKASHIDMLVPARRLITETQRWTSGWMDNFAAWWVEPLTQIVSSRRWWMDNFAAWWVEPLTQIVSSRRWWMDNFAAWWVEPLTQIVSSRRWWMDNFAAWWVEPLTQIVSSRRCQRDLAPAPASRLRGRMWSGQTTGNNRSVFKNISNSLCDKHAGGPQIWESGAGKTR